MSTERATAGLRARARRAGPGGLLLLAACLASCGISEDPYDYSGVEARWSGEFRWYDVDGQPHRVPIEECAFEGGKNPWYDSFRANHEDTPPVPPMQSIARCPGFTLTMLYHPFDNVWNAGSSNSEGNPHIYGIAEKNEEWEEGIFCSKKEYFLNKHGRGLAKHTADVSSKGTYAIPWEALVEGSTHSRSKCVEVDVLFEVFRRR